MIKDHPYNTRSKYILNPDLGDESDSENDEWLLHIQREKRDDINKITDGIFLGNREAGTDFQKLKDLGIVRVLRIGTCKEIKQYAKHKGLEYMDLIFDDTDNTDLIPHLDKAIPFIRKGNVLVHCFAGLSRSSSILIGYLMKEKGMGYLSAYYLVKSKRPCITPNMGFVNQLVALEYNS